ncbi:MAG: TonB-dependent receptor [Acidobacteria bacterium]|jgi:iron complex outermembrane receptor protein|nr:TonB-dependent receptor [Acidobacteriota bacterium]
MILILVLMPVALLAQESEPETPTDESAEGQTVAFTGEIIVNAQRREEALVDVPISVTSNDADQLDKAVVYGIMDLEKLVPGMRVDQYGAYAQPTIRGVGTQDVTGPGANANVAIYVDGFYMPSQAGNIFDFANVERVDVLKGPQGTLFGQNATGGAILVTTPDPSFNPNGYVLGSYGSFNDYRGSIYGTTGLSDTFAMDWSLYYRKSDNYLEDITTAEPSAPIHYKVARTKLMYKPSDRTKVILSLEYSDLNDPTGLGEVTGQPIAQFYNDFYGVPITTTLEPGKTSLNFQTLANPVTKTASLKGVFDIGSGVTLTSLTQYRDQDSDVAADLDGTTIQYWHVDYTELQETFTQEFNFGGAEGRFDWTAGVFYLHDVGSLTNNAWQDIFNTGTQTNWLSSDVEVTTDSIAAYGDVVIGLTENFWLTVGGRFTSEEKSLASQGLLDPFISFEDSTKWNEFTPRAVLRWAPNEGSSLYGSISQGFMSGNYQYTTVGPQEAVDPERITQYEIGFKTSHEKSSFSTAVYFQDYKDLQVYQWSDACACFILDNAPKAESYGWEGQLGYSLTKNLSFNLGAAYTNAQYKEYIGSGITGDPYFPPSYGFATAPTDFNGRQMLRTPKWTGNLAVLYNLPVSFGQLYFAGNYYFTDDIPLSPGGELVQDAYGLLSGRVGWTSRKGTVSISVFGNNLLDEEYLIFSAAGFLGNNHIYGAPRSAGVQFDFRY